MYSPDELHILWTNADPVTAEKMVFMYASNALKQQWWKKVTIRLVKTAGQFADDLIRQVCKELWGIQVCPVYKNIVQRVKEGVDVFNSIGNINWANLKQAHGNAEHVPVALKGLISEDKKEQEASYWKLDNHVVLQGDLYPAAFYVIPFLLEILAASIRNGRSCVYDLLFEIANGVAVEEVQCDYNGLTLTLTEGCKRSVADGLNLYLEEISDNGSVCRENALDLIVSLEEYVGNAISRLVELRDKEINLEFKDKLVDAITEISVENMVARN